MPNTEPIEIKFLINSPEVAAAAKKVKESVSGVTNVAKEQTAQMGALFDALFKKVSASLKQTFGEEKITALNTQLQSVEGEAQQLATIFGFVKDNISDLKLSPEASADLVNQIDQVSAALNDANANFDETNQVAGATFATIIEDMQKAQAQTGNLLTQLRELRYAIAGAIAEHGEGSPEVLKLTQQAGELEQRLKNARKQVALFGSNTAGIDVLKQGFNGILGGVTAAISAFSLFSDDSDQLQKTMVKLFAVMQAVTGAEQFLSVVNKNSAVTQYLLAQYRKLTTTNTVAQTTATEGLAVAQGVQTAATEGATGAMVALDAAMDANPVGIIIAAIAALAAGIVILSSNTQNQVEIQKELNDALAETNEILVKLVESSAAIYEQNTKDANNAVSLAQAQGKSQQEILDLKKKAIEAEKQEALYKLSALSTDEQTGKLLSQIPGWVRKNNNDLEEGVKLMELQNESLNKQIKRYEAIPEKQRLDAQNEQLAALKSQQKALEAILNPAQQYLNILKNSDQKLDENHSEAIKAQQEASLKSAAAIADARVITAKKGSQDELTAQIASINAHRAIELADVNKTAGERVKINADADKQILETRISFNNQQLADQESFAKAAVASAQKGSIDEFNAKVALIELEGQKEENQYGITAARRIEIEAETAKQITDLRRQYNFESQQEEIETAKATTEAKLADAQKGSDEELNLRKKLADQQAQLDISSAEKSITNETLLAAKIKEIYAKLLADKKKMDDQAAEQQMRTYFAGIDRNVANRNLPFEAVLNDQTATQPQRANAQLNIDLNNQLGLDKKLLEAQNKLTDARLRGSKNIAEFQRAYDDLNLSVKQNAAIIDNDKKAIEALKLQDVSAKLQTLSQSFSSISQELQQSNPELAAIAGAFANMASEANNLVIIFDKASTNEQKFAAGMQGLVDLIGMLSSASAQRAQAEAQFQTSLIQQQDEYNKALNNSIVLNEQLKNSVFVTDYAGELSSEIVKLSDATDKYNDALKSLSQVKVTVGEHDAIDLNNVLTGAGSGAAIGAAVGSVVPVIGTAIGAVVGGIGGAIAGILGGKKKKDTLAPILEAWPQLIDKSKTGIDAFNDSLAQSLIDAKLVKGASAQILQSIVDWKKQVQDTQKEIANIVQTLAGDLGNNLRNSLVSAFEDGTDAGKAFADSVGQSLENVLSQLIFNQVFGNAFQQLQKQMEDSFSVTGDKNWQDDLQSFFGQYVGLSTEFDDQLKAAQKAAKAAGLDIFQSTNSDQQQQGLVGAISRSITEDTANELAGLERGQYDTIKRQFSVLSQSLAVQQKIEVNTANTVTRLDSAISELKKISTNTKPSQTSRDLGVH